MIANFKNKQVYVNEKMVFNNNTKENKVLLLERVYGGFR